MDSCYDDSKLQDEGGSGYGRAIYNRVAHIALFYVTTHAVRDRASLRLR
jgi:hypothetical protein